MQRKLKRVDQGSSDAIWYEDCRFTTIRTQLSDQPVISIAY